MKHEDEDYGYEQERQRKLDAKVVIGSDLKDCDKIQKSVHVDPRPDLPFADDVPYDKVDEYIGYGLAILAVLILIITGMLAL